MQVNEMHVDDAVVRRAVVDIAAALVESNEALHHFTCTEVDRLAQALARLGMQDEGESLILMHVEGDGRGDDRHGLIVADDDDETLIPEAETMVRVYVEAMADGRTEPGAGIEVSA